MEYPLICQWMKQNNENLVDIVQSAFFVYIAYMAIVKLTGSLFLVVLYGVYNYSFIA